MRNNKLQPVKRGDTWNFVFAWKNNNSPTNLTGCTARTQIRTKKTGELMCQATTDDFITIDGTAGLVTVSYPPTITSGIDPGTYETDIEITFPITDQVQSSGTLQIEVDEDITR
ncbi:Domain of unknown function DUF2479 [uncultured Caudovirales phage]|uniref:Uncharacterized protein n=1 Tax=uncultured Caudovirales phage TaxID=2100421 RepID=A0A6J5KZ04_9CAUD|nr:Domain of unknown function DUF2479 [uncultured Caudovirales phage]CAB5208535.1 Domain of unknown function DUF2479 [uncultured Caudovirales phage]